ncbi:Bacterial type II secretion system protein F domain protein [Vibrio mediterranei]|jgi:tight adherence protein C|uniref:type II secretion system F family protein n=1 Tax=Vibrio mediterranei TaxID=689 RepID=UPI0007845621|nr:type II secretion system F family protein [Vibrio mediterranei]MCG9658682.1 type II secretion system F family protein [Vibrio mediterranei]MCG9661712.1 type II secretion system F family protein [Vibrio mediterranei]PTC04059.1 type II secretion system F family protein [Vibrio mediterranei]SBO11803.1 Bacterial type II secretion system protein F domain protein [Vibrio mediterranei]
MIVLICLFTITFAIAFLVFEMVKTNGRQRKIKAFISKSHTISPVKNNRIIIGFAKEQRKELEQKLLDAGYYNKNLAKYYLPTKFFLALCLSLAILFMDIEVLSKVIVVVVVMITVIIVPDFILDVKKKLMVRKISRNLPYVLDIMSVCVQTGMTIEASFDYLHKELAAFDSDLSYQIKKTSDSGKIHGIEKALSDLNNRLPAPEVQSFVLTIIQNLQYGTSVANILSDLAEDMRRIQLLKVEEKVGKLSAKMSVPLILLIMFPIVILILAPGVMQLDFTSLRK